MLNYFVSSTFRDMQSERDVLQNLILSEVRKYASIRGHDVFMTDLRWGIDTSNTNIHESMKKIMSICMKEIEYCCPHMIILLGDRYGSIPDDEEFNAFLQNSQVNDFSVDDKGKSITELEIIHGLFHLQNKGGFTICIRDPLPREEMPEELVPAYFETEEQNREKLERLKQLLITAFPQNVLRYSVKWDNTHERIVGMEDFTQKMTNRLCSQIDEFSSEMPTPEEAQLNADSLAVKSIPALFAGRTAYLQDIGEFMESPDASCLLIYGSSGMGKSSLMAKTAEIYASSFREAVFFLGNNTYIRGGEDLLRHLLYRLCIILGEDYANYDGIRSVAVLKEIVEKLIQQNNERFFILLDDPDDLESEKGWTDFIPEIKDPQKCKIIVATSHAVQERFMHGSRAIRLDAPDEKETSEIIEKQLVLSRKELPPSVKNMILRKTAYHSPLYTSMVLYRIINLNQVDFDNVSNFIPESGNESQKLYAYIEHELSEMPEREAELAVYLADFCRYDFAFPFSSTALQTLSAFPEGLRIEDVLGIAENLGEQISPLDLKLYLSSMSSLICFSENNRIRFLHRSTFEVFADRFTAYADPVYQASVRYFKGIADDDRVKLTEFLRAAYHCGDCSVMAEYLASLYLKDEELRLAGETTDFLNTAMFSLGNIYREIQDPDEKASLIENILNGISETKVREIYGLCCAFLFTYDAFFEHDALLGKADSIMKLINEKCIRVLYTHRDENPLYLRAVYVSCEQRGIRTNDYDVQYEAYFQFHEYCFEMFERRDQIPKYRVEIYCDFSFSFSKLASLYRERDWRKAVALYDRAVEIVNSCTDTVGSNSFRLKDVLHSTSCDEASCIIQKALLNQKIGWPMDDEMRSCLKKAENMLLAAREYFRGQGHKTSSLVHLTYCCMNLADLARVVSSIEDEIQYTGEMIKYAQLAYNMDHDLLTFDLIRNGEFRLGYISAAGNDEEKHLKTAFQMAKVIGKELNTNRTEQILYYAGGKLLRHNAEIIKQLPESQDDLIGRMCLQILEEFIPIAELLFGREEGEENYQAVISVFKTVMRNFEVQHHSAVQGLENGRPHFAYQKSLSAYHLLLKMNGQYDDRKWLYQILDTSHLLAVSSHNARVALYNSRKDRDLVDELLFTEETADAKMYASLLKYKMNFGEDVVTKKYQSIWSCVPFITRSALYGCIDFISECVRDTDGESTFWKYMDDINFRLLSDPQAYFSIVLNDSMKKESEEQILTVGQYFYSHCHEERVQKFLYFNTVFEDIALEYAYSVMDYEIAEEIIENGYDRYLELSTLYILRKHDRKEFLRRINELKFICLKKHKAYLNYHHMGQITGVLFHTEMDELIRTILSSKKKADVNDPRRHSARSVFKFSGDKE